MKNIALMLFFLFFLARPAFASTQQAYQDYMYQFNLYRQKDAAFITARDQYKQFQTLNSQSTAIAAAREMMSQRDLLYRSYLLYLKENILANQGMNAATKQQYLTIITQDTTFFESHYLSLLTVKTIDDAIRASTQIEDQSMTFHTHMYRIISMLALGRVMEFGSYFDRSIDSANSLIGAHAADLSPEKRAMVGQWMAQITAKRSAFALKVEDLRSLIDQVTASDATSLEQQYNDITGKIMEAAAPLSEGVSYMQELIVAVKYVN